MLFEKRKKKIKGSTAQFGKSIRPKILPHTKVITGREYCIRLSKHLAEDVCDGV